MSAGSWLSMAIFWVVVVGLVVWVVGRLFPPQAPSDPWALLDARLASGEITPEAYRSIRDELGERAPAETKGSR